MENNLPDAKTIRDELMQLEKVYEEAKEQEAIIKMENDSLTKNLDLMKSENNELIRQLDFYKTRSLNNIRKKETLAWNIQELGMKMNNFSNLKECFQLSITDNHPTEVEIPTTTDYSKILLDLHAKKETLLKKVDDLMGEHEKIRSQVESHSQQFSEP